MDWPRRSSRQIHAIKLDRSCSLRTLCFLSKQTRDVGRCSRAKHPAICTASTECTCLSLHNHLAKRTCTLASVQMMEFWMLQPSSTATLSIRTLLMILCATAYA